MRSGVWRGDGVLPSGKGKLGVHGCVLSVACRPWCFGYVSTCLQLVNSVSTWVNADALAKSQAGPRLASQDGSASGGVAVQRNERTYAYVHTPSRCTSTTQGRFQMLSLTKPTHLKIPSVSSKTYRSGAKASTKRLCSNTESCTKTKTSIRIPDIPSVGLAWPRGCPLFWWVRCRFSYHQ